MRTTLTMTVSLPPEMLTRFETVRKAESRTRSELVREALRTYFEARYPAVRPTGAELTAIRRGRADYAPLKEIFDELDTAGHGTRAETATRAARKRPRPA
jgi:predicted transcriptional regulator